MEQYDVLIVGNDIGSLVTALFLARKMRKVVVFSEPEPKSFKDIIELSDDQGNKYTFKNHLLNTVPGIEKPSLMYRFLNLCGLSNDLQTIVSISDKIVKKDNTMVERLQDFEGLLIYFVRYYPKQRDRIHKFFRDLKRHFDNYVEQQYSMIANTGYTISSLMIEWGDYSLKDLLQKYFTDPALIDEFMYHPSINGLNMNEVSCYNYFINFFTGVYSKEYYLNHSIEDIRKLLLTKLSAINRNIIQNRTIKQIILDSDGTVLKVIADNSNEFHAKHYVIAGKPHDVYQNYFPELDKELLEVLKYYPHIETNKRIQPIYLGLNHKPESIGIDSLNYFFETNENESVKLVRMFNEKLFNKDACSNKNGAIILEVVYDEGTKIDIPKIISQLEDIFPKLAKSIAVSKLGKIRPIYSMLSLPEVRKGLSIDDQIAIETLSRQQIFENLYLIGDWLRPEAGLFGLFQAGIIYGDAIEEKLYYGDDDDEFFYLSNDEIMMMLRHNYGKKLLGKTEKHINFHIGKSNYFIRTKAKNITVHRGEYFSPDLSIYTTNDKLSSLLLKKTTLEDVLKSGGFKYQGKESDLFDIAEAFNLDDYKEEDTSYQPKSKIYFLGVKFLFFYLMIWSAMAFLSNFIKILWVAPFALILTLLTTYTKYLKYRDISWFEYLMNSLLALIVLTSALWPAFNNALSDDIYLGMMALVFLISWIVNKPIVHDFHQYDFKRDYAQSSLFKVINNGLTLVWSLIFISILVFTYVTGERYISALYNLVFLGFFMTYFYPVLYVRGNIKS
ncbi:MAG: hypothetical protein CVV56_02845 [Tenericutes bacterium HGW-Tenericutes-1]|jgi:hypothetical protein|nr:MAG: hypothetical protein CVV56_02845 [Tenericutes bacterium HGW-Tenericutes-1]